MAGRKKKKNKKKKKKGNRISGGVNSPVSGKKLGN